MVIVSVPFGRFMSSQGVGVYGTAGACHVISSVDM